ncbi:MAG: dTDP-4-dehydrorhamnose 3,5-epimerase family protein [Deltaproteobacteria bacterium]|nr:dTDP-4-dehydrorhamnose 3,5-epimerase family protein [Deltaproteobacteria bacterium]
MLAGETEHGRNDLILIEADLHRDDRGFFLETWQRERYAESGIDFDFVQDNHSRSARSVCRG